MDDSSHERAASYLEGLLLHDDAGVYYAVPRAVFERYRVPPDLLVDFAPLTGGNATPWRVVRGIYATEQDTRRAQ